MKSGESYPLLPALMIWLCGPRNHCRIGNNNEVTWGSLQREGYSTELLHGFRRLDVPKILAALKLNGKRI